MLNNFYHDKHHLKINLKCLKRDQSKSTGKWQNIIYKGSRPYPSDNTKRKIDVMGSIEVMLQRHVYFFQIQRKQNQSRLPAKTNTLIIQLPIFFADFIALHMTQKARFLTACQTNLFPFSLLSDFVFKCSNEKVYKVVL